MKKTKNAGMLLVKCFWKKINLKLLLSLVLFISILFVSVFSSYLFTKNKVAIKEGYEKYGKFQFQIFGIDKEILNQISTEPEVKDSCIYACDFLSQEGTFLYYISEEFFEFSNVSIVKGRFPENSNEILCEQKFLYKNGMEFEEDNTYITVDGTRYKVSGIVYIDNVHTAAYTYNPVMFLDIEEYELIIDNFEIACMTKSYEYVSIAERIFDKYDISKENYSYNNNVLTYAEVDEYNKSTDIFNTIKYVIFLISFIMIVFISINIIIIMKKRIKSDSAIIHTLGITYNKIKRQFTKVIVILILIASLSAFFIVGILKHIYFNDYIDMYVVLASIVIFDITIVGVTFLYGILDKKRDRENISNIEDISVRRKNKSILHRKRMPFLAIAKCNMILNKKRHFISIIIIASSIIFIATFNYVSDYIFEFEPNDKYEYRIDYEYSNISDIMYGSPEINEMYNKMCQAPQWFELTPIYYYKTSVILDKGDISEEYKEYYGGISNDYYIKFYVNKTGKYTDDFIFIGADEKQLHNLYNCSYDKLENDECIIVDKVSTPNKTGFLVGLDVGTEFQYEYVGDDDETPNILKVVEHIGDLEIDIPNTDYKVYVIVNMDVFQKLEFFDYPQMIYFNDLKNNEKYVYDFFKGIQDISIVNIEEKNAMVRSNLIKTTILVYGLIMVLVILLVINTIISLIDRYDYNERKMAMMKAMGINNKRLSLILLYDYLSTVGRALIIGALGTVFACYISHKKLCDIMYYFVFKIPISKILIPLGLVLSILIIAIIPATLKIRNMNINKALQGSR